MFKRSAEPGTPLSHLMSDGRDGLDAGQLVRALARSIVHVPMPGEAAEKQPRVVSTRDGDLPPLFVIEDEGGRHALIYSTPRRLVESFGGGATAASIPFATLLLAWPEETDLVIDAGHPDALEVPAQILHHVQLEAAGIPTGTALEPAPGDHTSAPESELQQVVGTSRVVAAKSPEVAAMWRAVTLARRAGAPARDRRARRLRSGRRGAAFGGDDGVGGGDLRGRSAARSSAGEHQRCRCQTPAAGAGDPSGGHALLPPTGVNLARSARA